MLEHTPVYVQIVCNQLQIFYKQRQHPNQIIFNIDIFFKNMLAVLCLLLLCKNIP